MNQTTQQNKVKTLVRGLHHFAIRTTNMAETKAFYTGMLDLAHTQTWKEEYPDPKNGPQRYMHCFFELGDGSSLAFFQFAEGEHHAPESLPIEVFDHHIALRVGNKQELLEIKKKYEVAGRAHAVMDHGYCWSLYTRDPNNLLVEIAVDPPGIQEIMAHKVQTAATELDEFLSGNYEVSNHVRSYEHSDLPISSMEEIEKVVVPPEHR